MKVQLDLAQLALQLLGAGGHRAHGLDLAISRGRVALCPDPRVRLVLLGAQPLQPGEQRPPALVQLDHAVEAAGDLVAAARERRANAVGVLPDALEVEHAPPPPRRASYFVDSVMFTAGTFCAWRPEYWARKLATACASLPRTMFSGMIAPEKPPLRIA